MILIPCAQTGNLEYRCVHIIGTFGLYPDDFRLQQAPAGPSRPQQVLRHTPEPFYVTLGSSVAEGLRATSNNVKGRAVRWHGCDISVHVD